MSLWDILIPKPTDNFMLYPTFTKWVTGLPVGWTKTGLPTVTEVPKSYRGPKGVEIVSTGSDLGIYYDLNVGSSSYDMMVSVYLNIPSSPATNYKLRVTDGNGSTNPVEMVISSPVSRGNDGWQRLYINKNTPVSGIIRIWLLVTSGTGTFSAIQVEPSDISSVDTSFSDLNITEPTTFFSGDEIDAHWVGARDVERSTHGRQQYRYGTWKDFETLSFYPKSWAGMGLPNTETPMSFSPGIDGRVYGNLRKENRIVTLAGLLHASTLSAYHDAKTELLKALGLQTNGVKQPVTIRYRGGSKNVIFRGVAETGLTGAYEGSFAENIVIRFACEKANLELEDYAYNRELFGNNVATVAFFENNIGISGKHMGPFNLTGTVYVMRYGPDGMLYIGGSYGAQTNFPNANLNAFDGVLPCVGLGTAPDGAVLDVLASADGTIYVCGEFLNIGGVAGKRIAKRSAAGTWSVMGNGFDARVRKLAMDSLGNIYAVGDFVFDGTGAGTQYNRIAKWNGSSWSAIGTGLNGIAYAIVIDAINQIYVGGAFTTANGSTANKIVKIVGTTYTRMTNAEPASGEVHALSFDGVLNLWLGGTIPENIKLYNWTSLVSLNGGVNGDVKDLKFFRSQMSIVGSFSADVIGQKLPGQGTWNGQTFSPPVFFCEDTSANFNTIDYSPLADTYVIGGVAASANQMSIPGLNYLYKSMSFPSNSAPTKPTIYIHNTHATLTQTLRLLNSTTNYGKTLKFNLPILPNEEIWLDFENKRIISSFNRSLVGVILPGAGFDDFSLFPVDQTMHISLTGNVTGLDYKMRLYGPCEIGGI